MGRAPSALSKSSSTSQKSAGPRAPPPAKRTSSGFSARSSVGLSEPAAQRIASETLDLPEPFGPTITPTPGSRRTSSGSGNDLKPRSLTARRCTAWHPKEATGRYWRLCWASSRASGASSSACSPSGKISRIPRGSESSSSSMSRRKRNSELVGFRSVMRPEGCQKLGNVRDIELGERLPGRFLLGGLLRPALAATELLAVDDRRAREAAFVRGPVRRDLGIGDVATGPGEQLLQVGLVVDARGERVLDLVGEGVDDGVLDGGEAVLEEDRTERRLDHRREHVAVAREPFELLLRLGGSRVRDETLPEAELARHHRARRTRDDMRANLGELPLGEVGMAHVERVRDGELEHAVAEELEPLVRLATLARPRGVGEDVLRQLRRERVDQLREVGVGGYWCEVT